MPFLTMPFLERLAVPSDADLVVPRSARGYEPLCAAWAATAGDAILRRIDRGILKAALVMEELRVEEIGPDILGRGIRGACCSSTSTRSMTTSGPANSVGWNARDKAAHRHRPCGPAA